MKAGVIGEVESNTGDIDSFTTNVSIEHEAFDELQQCIQVTEDVRIPDGRIGQFGQAAIEDIVDSETTEIQDGEIRTYERAEKTVLSTYFLFVSGSFMAVNSSSGRFAFNLISDNTNHEVKKVEFDIDKYVEEHSDANPWKVGFYDNIGNTDNGIVHGDQLLTESELADVLIASPKNQIGLEYNFNQMLIKNFVTKSGYVEVYQPSDYSSGKFARFVEEELLPYTQEP